MTKRQAKPDDLPRHHPNSGALCDAVLKSNGPTVLLSFSGGKDAIAAWLQLRERGFMRIVPFYYYLVPGLEFVERSLRYYEEYFETPILRVPNPNLLRMLREFVFQPPERAAILESMAPLPSYRFEHLEAHVRRVSDVHGAWCAVGTRTADSPIRLANVRRYGSLNPKRRTFLPVYDWKIADVVASIERAGVRLSPEYLWFGRTFDGIDARFLAPMRDHAPRDYERVLSFFPMAQLEIMRRNLGATDAQVPQAL